MLTDDVRAGVLQDIRSFIPMIPPAVQAAKYEGEKSSIFGFIASLSVIFGCVCEAIAIDHRRDRANQCFQE